jgi:hypothetical protein
MKIQFLGKGETRVGKFLQLAGVNNSLYIYICSFYFRIIF